MSKALKKLVIKRQGARHCELYNAMLKGSAFGAFMLWFFAMLAFDADVPGALFLATLSGAYFSLFVLVNKDVLGG